MSTPKNPVAIQVGLRLRAARLRRGFEVTQVAEETGFDRQTIATWENGFAFPPIPKLIELCRLYKCSTDEIITGAEPDRWEDAVVLMPVDLREKTLIIKDRSTVGNLVPALNQMTDAQLARLEQILPQLVLVGDNGMAAVDKIIDGLAGLITSSTSGGC